MQEGTLFCASSFTKRIIAQARGVYNLFSAIFAPRPLFFFQTLDIFIAGKYDIAKQRKA